MTTAAARGPRRTDALSRARIVEAAVDILDAAGDQALTVRALTTQLTTGRGAIYHHVAGMEDLCAAAADVVLGRAMAEVAIGEDPGQTIRALSMSIFDAIDAHPWVGTQLARDPLQPAVLQMWKAIGVQLEGLSVTGSALSNAGSALVNYVLGSAAQYAAGPGQAPDDATRRAYLRAFATQWVESDSSPLTHQTASMLHEHDDRQQFLAGVDIFLAGIAAQAVTDLALSKESTLTPASYEVAG